MAVQSIVRVTKKQQYNEQYFFDQTEPAIPELGTSSVRIQARLLGLSANNLSYCARGDELYWYKAFPLPGTLPAPFNSLNDYAIAPGWGYAEILQSTIDGLRPGTMLYGFIPTSSMITDLKLKPSAGAKGHWTEVSEHREKVMSIYCRYMEADEEFASKSSKYSRLWKAALFPAWKSGYLLNKYVFASRPEDPVTSMFPSRVPWSKGDADLSESVVITLGSRSKTCRSFVQQMATNRAAGAGPVALFEVSSTKESIVPNLDPSYQHDVLTYEDACSRESLQQIADLGAKRTVILDFAGRGNALEQIIDHLQGIGPSIQITVVGIGSGHGKVFSKADLQARMERNAAVKALPMNATDILDAVIDKIGEEKTYELIHGAWDKVTSEQERSSDRSSMFLGMELDVRSGVRGEGVERVWTQLCEGKATGDMACVVKF